MKGSRITAVGLVVAAVAWIASGHLIPRENADSRAAVRAPENAAKLFRVAVQPSALVQHQQKLVLSGRTEADRKLAISARTSGLVIERPVNKGDRVKKGDVIAVMADEAREAQVAQAKALVQQRRTELEARTKLIEKGMMPKLEAVNLESQLRTAEASLASAEAERDRGVVRAPWDGIITSTSVEVGQSSFSLMGTELAQMISLDPMLAVVEVAERKLAGIRIGARAEVRLVTGQTASGKVRFVAKTAAQATRTYRVEIEVPNPDAAIPDGITAEVAIPLAATMATRVPRSALTFSSAGDLGVRMVDDKDVVQFVPVALAADEQQFMWVTGLADKARVIVEGQDFVREGQKVAVMASAQIANAEK
jgi:multidrug efflux system membrane fusion protein